MSENNLYSEFKKEELILRDYLAAERTVFANERTFLAYIRTSIALLLSGVTFIHFSNSIIVKVSGSILIFSGIITFYLGLMKFLKMNKVIYSIKQRSSEVSEELLPKSRFNYIKKLLRFNKLR